MILLPLAMGGCGSGLDTFFTPPTPLPLYEQTILREPALVGYWRMNETSGTTIANSLSPSPFGSGTLNTVAGSDFVLGVTGPLFGSPDTAINFTSPGNAAVTMISGPFAFSTSGFSIEVWVNYTTTLGSSAFVYFSKPGANPQIRLGSTTINGFPGAELSINDSNGINGLLTEPTLKSSDGAWHHLVGVVDSSARLHLYRDGVDLGPAGPIAFTGDFTVPAGPFININPDHNPVRHTTGGTAQVAVYNAPLSLASIAAHYRIGITGQ